MIVGENEMTGPPLVQRHIGLLNVQVYLEWKVKTGYQNRTRRSVLGRKMSILSPFLSSVLLEDLKFYKSCCGHGKLGTEVWVVARSSLTESHDGEGWA